MIATMRGKTILGIVLASATAIVAGPQSVEMHGNAQARAIVEELVHARTDDGIVNGGALFTPQGTVDKRIAVIWIHGTRVNFYYPTYVAIGRELAQRGLTTIMANTRMHDLGNIAAFRGSEWLRGGSYWGITTDQTHDLSAWIQFARDRGFSRVVLVGHSAGATAVQIYQARTQDSHVAGLVLASGRFRPASGPVVDAARLALARQFLADGRGEDPVPRATPGARPSATSAATLVDLADMGVELSDFYGVEAADAPIARVRVPLLAWFGTNDDVGTEADLELLEKTLKTSNGGPTRVTTAMIPGAGHMYEAHEAQVAQLLASWVQELATGR